MNSSVDKRHSALLETFKILPATCPTVNEALADAKAKLIESFGYSSESIAIIERVIGYLEVDIKSVTCSMREEWVTTMVALKFS